MRCVDLEIIVDISMDEVELAARLAVHPVSACNFATFQLVEIAMDTDPEHRDPAKGGFPVIPEVTRQDDLIENEINTSSSDRCRCAMVRFQCGEAERTEVQADAPLIIPVEKEPICSVVKASGQHGERIIDARKQIWRRHLFLKGPGNAGLSR